MSALGQAARRTRQRAIRLGAGDGRLAGARVRGPIPADRRAEVLLASEGRPFSAASIVLAAELAAGGEGGVLVLSMARVHGVALGLPNPGLMPTKAEWEEQRDIVARAVKRLRRQGVEAEGQVLGTRNPAKRICALAEEVGAGAIVMGADPNVNRLVGPMLWSQEPQQVKRRAAVPVHLVDDGQ
ncbi:universal stress protein [Conexibacter sp. DBS9H8]|uniref:universal stress protein n=1 Tax=Conexibacter sp. DBS9H8 TaxID=2937801 RepID=UPI00200D5FA0|nr:universal stress protein [Conexibacter sp. DBS9H8]